MSQTVFIVDDDDAMRDSLTWLLEGEGYQVNNYPSAEDFLTMYSPQMRGVLVLDVRMPEMSGLELHEKLIALNNQLPVIFVTGHGDVPMAVSALQSGAWDFIEKPFANADLLARIEKALARERERSERQSKNQSYIDRAANLTQREREVMLLVVEGNLNKQIADTLNISMKTVEAHRARVMEKMGVDSLPELVKVCLLLEGQNQ
ncbi:MAG TPA: response regulator transcription factor [Rhodocyclaceae bacterium]|nr:response regulator transcription factor [Rhodocyclaceae bacterium]